MGADLLFLTFAALLVLMVVAPDHTYMLMFAAPFIGMVPVVALAGAGEIWVLFSVAALVVILVRSGIEHGDRPHWMTHVAHLVIPTAGIDVDSSRNQTAGSNTPTGNTPWQTGSEETGRDGLGLLGLLDDVLSAPNHEQQPTQRPTRRDPVDYETVPDEGIFNPEEAIHDVEDIDDVYRQ